MLTYLCPNVNADNITKSTYFESSEWTSNIESVVHSKLCLFLVSGQKGFAIPFILSSIVTTWTKGLMIFLEVS